MLPPILLVIDDASIGGGQQHVLALAERLIGQGLEVAVACEASGYLVDELRGRKITQFPLRLPAPNATLVKAVDRTDPMAHVTLGANIYIKKKYMIRLEYNNYKVFTSRNDNEEIGEWKAGFAAFF